jgi:hypothetical protein
VRALTLLAILAVAGCGASAPPPRHVLVAAADAVCEDAAVPAISPRAGAHLQARLATLAAGQERRELRRLHALRWRELERALAPFDDALPHLDAFARSRGRDVRERAAYDRLLARWQSGSGAIGLDVCSRFGFSY